MVGRAYPRKRPEYGSYRWYQSQLGRMDAQVGPDPATWEAGAVEFYHDIINRGAMRVYFMDDLSDGFSHKWKFLRVRFTIQTTSGKQDYQLPDDCGGIVGNLAFDSSDSGYSTIYKSAPEEILKWRSINTNVSSYPERFAEEFTDDGGLTSQGRRLMLWPSPDASYTLNGEMDVTPVEMNEDTRPFGYGGRPLVETLLASMMAIVSPELDELYRRRLRAAVQYDESHALPEFLGKNLNGRKGWMRAREDGRFTEFNPVTYSG